MKKQAKNQFRHVRLSKSGPASAPHRVSWQAEGEGGGRVRHRKHFASLDDAKRFAADLDRELENHGRGVGSTMPPAVRRAYGVYVDAVAGMADSGSAAPDFESLVRDAVARMRAEHEVRGALTVRELRRDFLAAKVGTVGALQLSNLRSRTAIFDKSHGRTPAATIRPATVEKWLASLKTREGGAVSPQYRNHLRGAVGAMFAWGAHPARRLIPENPVAAVGKAKVGDPEPLCYAPQDAAKLLETARADYPDLLPCLALGFFGGLRPSEAIRMSLESIQPTEEEFRVGKSKTRARSVPLRPPLVAWLGECPRRRGKAWEGPEAELYRALRELHATAGVDAIQNGLRHSHISYAVAESRDSAAVADYCATSPGVIAKHYRSLKTATEAAAFFAIRPSMGSENILPLASAR